MADIDNLSIRISASTGVAVKNINNLTNALRSLNDELSRVDPSKLNGVANAASTFRNATRGMGSASKTISKVASDFQNFGQQAGSIAQVSDATQGVQTAFNGVANAANSAASATNNGASQAQNLSGALNNVSNNARRASKSLRDTGKNTTSTSANFKGLTKELTRISKMLKLMVTRMVLRKVIQGVIDGFKNLAQYSSTFDATLSLLWNSLRQLGNSIAAAVSPLLNALAPAINYIIQLCIKAVNVINQLISAIAGLGTWTRAKKLTDSYAGSLQKASGAAKELKKSVLGFDELNQLQDNKDSGGGGGGTSPADMFEQAPIDPRILKFLDDLKKDIASLKPYWDAFVKGFLKGLGDWRSKVALIKDGLLRIRDALVDIWNDPNVKAARERYFLSLAEMLGAVVGTIARIGLNIGANLAQGIAASLEEKAPEIKEYLVEMFDIGTHMNQQIEEFALAIGRISDVLVGENAIAATKGFSNLFLESFMLVTENAARLGDSLVTLITQPIIDNESKITEALDGLFGILASLADFVQTVVKDIRSILSDAWGTHIYPMFSSLTTALSGLVGALMDAWNNNIRPLLQEVMDMLKPLWEQYVEPIVNDIINIVTTAANIIAKYINAVIVPAIKILVDMWFPRIRDAISVIISWIKMLFQIVSTVVQNFTWILRTLLEFVETAFTQGWDAACQQLSQSWAKHWDEMLEKLKGIANSAVEVVEKMINAIVHGINAIGDKIGDKLKNISFPAWLGGGSFSLEIPHLSEVSLPRFKNGGFVEDGLFTMNHNEIAGKFSNGKNVVANNEQITDGIARAVFNAMTSAQSSGGGQYINNTIMVDGMVLARTVTKGQKDLNRRYSPTMA